MSADMVIEQLCTIFKGLSYGLRLQIVQLLAESAELSLLEITNALGGPSHTVWDHLKLLVGAGIVTKHKDDRRSVLYTLNPSFLDSITAWVKTLEVTTNE